MASKVTTARVRDVATIAIATGLLLGLVPLAGDAEAHGYKQKSIEIVHPWTRDAFEPSTRDALVGMEIKNKGALPDRLISAACSLAERVELRSQLDGPPAPWLDIAPKGAIELGRNGTHIRLIGLKKSLLTYDTIPVTLVFAKGGTIKIDVLVEEAIGTAK